MLHTKYTFDTNVLLNFVITVDHKKPAPNPQKRTFLLLIILSPNFDEIEIGIEGQLVLPNLKHEIIFFHLF